MSKRYAVQGLLLGAAVATGIGIGYAIAAQPHMEAALGLLQSARGELEVAEHNKGGHRVTAIHLIDDAIHEVREGLDRFPLA